MLQAVEGMIDQEGKLVILGDITLPKSRRVIITILDEAPHDKDMPLSKDETLEYNTPSDEISNLALLSQEALARDWTRPEENEAWSHLAQLPSL